jgi:hypothetical protein
MKVLADGHQAQGETFRSATMREAKFLIHAALESRPFAPAQRRTVNNFLRWMVAGF